MADQRARAVRGALAGAIAAGIWTLQTPLDHRVFGVRCDDSELLGKALTSGPAWRPLGLTLHVVNGALFGAAYARLAGRLGGGGPGWGRGATAGLVEHVASWPLLGVLRRHHPARDALPPLHGSRAFLQATWRHLLFGAIVGTLDERWNGDEGADPTFVDVHVNGYVTTNGHGDIAHAASGGGE